ncbi:uncharacterized protein LOC120800300 isoform X3 [Xiphias gladius]|uniref:uncharacterized protein LOC120800300 isoform X3 n=1 Tax=Xiphias gladius TaxID=8245 RepID=UPI001A997866|nr:uncharacterized protein LOC120800300 isoform X3 [Xiphias gladius]
MFLFRHHHIRYSSGKFLFDLKIKKKRKKRNHVFVLSHSVSPQAAEMLLYLCLLFAGCLRLSFTDSIKTVQNNTLATLQCPLATGNVSWSRYVNDPNVVVPKAQPEARAPVTLRNEGPDRSREAAAGGADTENQRPSDLWKIPVGVVIGATLVLLVFFALRFCSEKRAERETNVVKAVTEVIYEEIEDGNVQPRREPDVESPYYWSSIIETPNTSTSPNTNALYTSVNKLKAKGRGNEECVYSVAQIPLQTRNVS